MDVTRVDLFMMLKGKYFENYQLPLIRERMLQMDDATWQIIQVAQFQDPNTSLLISIVGGGIGIDRFMIGDTGLGIAKLLTCGGFGIWTIIDWFMIQGATREKNTTKLKEALASLGHVAHQE